jgi:hypothetical protein
MAPADGPIRNSGAYGADGPYILSEGNFDDRGRILPEALSPMWLDLSKNLVDSRKRILFVNDVVSGKKRGPVPRKHARNRDIYAPPLPSQFLRSLHNHNVLSRKIPQLKRYTSGIDTAPLERATRIEQWSDPMTEKLVSWDETVGMLQNEGEMAGLVCPAGADWSRVPPPFTLDDSAEGAPVLPEWWRDGDGQPIEAYLGAEGDLEPKRDPKKTRQAYEQALEDWELDNPAIKARLIHATDCVPVGLRIAGDGPSITGLVIRGLYSRVDLMQRHLIWGKGAELEHLSSAGPRDVELLEGWFTDAQGSPYVVYSVKGMATRWAGGDADDWAFIDLHERYGQRRLLAFYEYGWHLPVSDPNLRGMPFPYPFAAGDLAAQTLLGAAIANFYARGYGSRGIVPNKDAPPGAYMDGSAPRSIDWEPGGKLPVLPGEVVDLLPQIISPDVWRMFDLLHGAAMEQGPGPAAFGAGEAGSGRERTVIRKHIEDAEAHILTGALRMHQRMGIGILELGCQMIQKGVCGPIPVATKIPIATAGVGNNRKGLVVKLDPKDAQRNYALEAFFQPQPGDNLALAEQAKGLVEAGLRPRRWFHEIIMGDDSPENTEAEIVSDHMVFDEQGQQEIRDLALRLRNDEQEKQLKDLRAAGRVSPTGVPLAFAGGLQGPQAGGPVMAGPSVGAAAGGPLVPGAAGSPPIGVSAPTTPQGMLGGQVAAGMETGPIRGDALALQPGVPA